MKKFLFTLIALLMAGSMFASDTYFYMDDITLTKEEATAGCKKVVFVKAHFEGAVSAWEANFTLPEGVTIDQAAQGSDMTLTYQNQFVDDELNEYYAEATYTPNLSKNPTYTKFIVSVMDTKEFDPATGKSYGICWRPGDYDQMWRVRLVFPAGFTGGDIVINSQPACGASIMPGLTACDADGYVNVDKTIKVRIKADTPVIGVTGDDYSKTVTITAEEGATIYYSTDGVNYQVYNTPIVFDEEGTYKVYAYAEGPGEGVEQKTKSDVAESDEFTILKEQPKDLNGTINISDPDEDGKVTVTYTPGEGDPENVTLDVVVKDKDGNVVEATFENGVLQLPTYGEYTVTVTASATDYNDKEFDPETVKWEKKAVDAPVISYETYDTEVVVTISWPVSDGEHVYTGRYTYPRTDVDQSFDVEAYVTEGETCQESEHATKTIPVPKKEVIAKPTITFSGEETTTMTITVSCETEGVTLYVNGTAVEGNPYTYTVTRADVYTAGTVNVTAVAKKGDLESETATDSKAWVVQKPLAPEATKTETPADDKVTVNFTPAEGTAVSVKVDGETVDLPYDIDRPAYGEEPITVTFEVTVTGDNYTTNTYTVDVTVDPQDPTAAKPIITFTPDATGVTVEIENYTTYTITVNDVVVDQLRAVPTHIDKGDVDKHIVVWAKNAPANMIPAEDTKEYNLPAKTVYNTPDPVIGTPTVNENDVTFTVTGEGTVTVTVTYNGKTETYTGTDEVEVTIPRTDQDFTATVTATAKSNKEGYDVINEGTAGPTTVNVPAMQTAAPTIDVSFDEVDGKTIAYVTFKNNDENAATIWYSTDEGETWNEYNPAVPVTFTATDENQEITVWARAKADGKAMSEVEKRTFDLNNTATSVNELTNGKTVAGVRYFNMAGQEMQEANGITIVVTTYTDGTTSAVKVIK